MLLAAANIESAVLAEAQVPGIEITRVGSAGELGEAMTELAAQADVVVMAAAVADYRVADISEAKLTKESGGVPRLELVENEDILARLAAHRAPGQVVVGFAAETASGEELLARGRRKRAHKGADLLAVNQVGWQLGFETADNHLTIIGRDDEVVADAVGTKREVADALLDAVLGYVGHSSSGIGS